jgi:hypothetical protein
LTPIHKGREETGAHVRDKPLVMVKDGESLMITKRGTV